MGVYLGKYSLRSYVVTFLAVALGSISITMAKRFDAKSAAVPPSVSGLTIETKKKGVRQLGRVAFSIPSIIFLSSSLLGLLNLKPPLPSPPAMASTPNLYASSSPFLQFPRLHSQSHHQWPNLSFVSLSSSRRSLRCCSSSSSSNGRPDRGDDDLTVKEIERILEEKRRAQLAARIASGDFTAQKSRWISVAKSGLSKLGPPGKILEELLSILTGDGGSPERERPVIPRAKGSLGAAGGQAFFLPLYELFLTYGGIFRLIFGPKSFLIVSDPAIAKHILRDNPKAYSKGILAEILEFVMGKGLIPADGEIWRVRRRAIIPALHQKAITSLIG